MMKHAALAILALAALPFPAEAEVKTVKHRITGLFDKDRENDLREAVKKLTDVAVVSIEFDVAEVTFSYDPAVLFKGTKEKDYLERFDNLLKQASSHTFGVRPLCTTPKEKLTRIEIGIASLDCRACGLSIYESVAKIDGVEQATASVKDGQLTALIDPDKTNRAALLEALKKRQVTIKP